jgi:gliding motility-associated protein GldE
LEKNSILSLISILILLAFSAFFSGSEVALFSLDKKKSNIQLANNPLIRHYLKILLDAPRRLLVTILIGNTLVNVALSILSVILALDFASKNSISTELVLSFQIILLTSIIIVFGEISPKVWASKNPLLYSKIAVLPLYFLSVLIYPAAELISESIQLLSKKLGVIKRNKVLSRQDFSHLAEVVHELGTIQDNEHSLIKSIVSFKSVTVKEIMRPRVDIAGISINSTLEEIMKTITDSGHSRLPLYKDDLDEVVGIIYAKDLLPFLKEMEKLKQFNLLKIARKPMFVPETKLISDLMQEFQEKKMHIAIIVDEYGGTAGLVSLEDIIEEILGEIRDEYDITDEPLIKNSDGSFLVKGDLSITEINEILNIEIDTEDDNFETIGGFILNHAGTIPKEGYYVISNNYKFTVKHTLKKRILKVHIEKAA